MKRAGFLIGAAVIVLGAAGIARAGTLTLNVDTGTVTGTLRAAAYDTQASFDARRFVASAASSANGGPATVTFNGLEPGTYGIAVFLDKNGNDELDTNLFGAPTEPYGFSMNPEPGFAAPKFDAFRFEYDGNEQQLIVRLHGN